MKPPGVKRILDIDVNAGLGSCDVLRCSNCTRGLLYSPKIDMTPDNFRRACESLRDFVTQPEVEHGWVKGHRVIAMIGGNPCVHPRFPELCRVFAETIPQKWARGLWTNNLNGHGALARETFGHFNLNPHGSAAAVEEMRRELPHWSVLNAPDPNSPDPLKQKGFSLHAPVFTAIQDFVGTADVPDEAAMWEKIEQCDINKYWSGTIAQMPDGHIYGYFCEMTAVYERIYWNDRKKWPEVVGMPVADGWWKAGMENAYFAKQHRQGCRMCGVPLKLMGNADGAFTDDFSETHKGLHQIAVKRKQGAVFHTQTEKLVHVGEATDYTGSRTR